MLHSVHADGSTWVQLINRVVRISAEPAAAAAAATVAAFSAASERETLLCTAVSRSGRKFAVATDAKVVKVFSGEAVPPAVLEAEVTCSKRPAFLAFQDDESALLIADKGGDVMRVALPPGSEGATCELILGHLAMLTSIEPVLPSRYLATGDADARIRISRLPNAYNIQSFCLGHSAPVLGLSASLGDCLVSLSADGSVRTWRVTDGAELSQLQLVDNGGSDDSGRGVPYHLAVSEKHRRVACVSVATGDGEAIKDGSILLLSDVGPAPGCVLSNASLTTTSLGCGRVAACCHDSRLGCLLLLGDNPEKPIELRRFPDGAEISDSGVNPAVAWASNHRPDLAAAAKLRLDFYRDVLNYAALEATGYQEYFDNKAERIERLKLKRKRASRGGAVRGHDDGIDCGDAPLNAADSEESNSGE